MSETIQGKLAVVAKTAGIKLNIGGTETGWINPTKEAKETILPKIQDLKEKIGSMVEVTRTEDTVYSSIKVVEETGEEEVKEEKVEAAPPKEKPKAEEQKKATEPAPQPQKVPMNPNDGTKQEEDEEDAIAEAISKATEDAMVEMVARGQTKTPEYFKTLNAVKCDIKKLKVAGIELNYTSWAEAWKQLKDQHSDANYHVYEDPKTGMPYFSDRTGAFVKVSVTVCGVTHTVHLPVMDNRNKSVQAAMLDTFTINKNIQRAFAKCIAMHGIGLYVYAGEDFPEESG